MQKIKKNKPIRFMVFDHLLSVQSANRSHHEQTQRALGKLNITEN